MSWVVIIIVGVLWLIGQLSSSSTDKVDKQELEEAKNKYKNRRIDKTVTLFERNLDIIEQFKKKIVNNPTYYRANYYIENETRDCINEICLAESKLNLRPNSSYLSSWQNTAPTEWVELSRQVENVFRKKQQEIAKFEYEIAETSRELEDRKTKHQDPIEFKEIHQLNGRGEIIIDDIREILQPNAITWIKRETEILNYNEKITEFPSIKTETKKEVVQSLNNRIDLFNKKLKTDIVAMLGVKLHFKKIVEGYKKGQKDEVVERVSYIINDILLPKSIPKKWQVDYDDEQGIVIVEVKLPDVVHNEVFKKIELKSGTVNKPLNQKEAREKVPSIHPAIILRIAYEIFRNDTPNTIKLLIVNGWVEYDDPNTGILTKTYTASLAVEREQIIGINLQRVEPLIAFTNLKGKSAGKLIDIIPITPIMSLDRNDKRFIETKEVLSGLGSETNLASMDWQDFESLIAELFSKEFEKEGGEVKVTQASRDRGVDAVVFDPDPIKGGKFVIQAKRYTHTVDVSAVRDLCAVVKKEGASRGILVTTSTYGADAYAFANNEPVTLLNGAQLLGLLQKHGYTFRINLAEARKLNMVN